VRAQHAARPSTRLASAGQTRIFCSSRLEPRVWLVLVASPVRTIIVPHQLVLRSARYLTDCGFLNVRGLQTMVKAFEIDRTSEKLNQGKSFGIRGRRRTTARSTRSWFTLAACKGHRDLGSVL